MGSNLILLLHCHDTAFELLHKQVDMSLKFVGSTHDDRPSQPMNQTPNHSVTDSGLLHAAFCVHSAAGKIVIHAICVAVIQQNWDGLSGLPGTYPDRIFLGKMKQHA